ncbi:MAG: hypothetical protein WC365_06050 [Candidatus Babeliales bacterium]
MRVSKLRVLASCAMVMMVSSIHAYTNKTYMTPRPVDVNVPWWNTTYEDLIFEGKNNSCGGIIQLTGLYQESTDRDNAAKYFLLHDKSTVNIIATQTETNAVGDMNDVDITYLINYALFQEGELATINDANFTLGLKPCRKVVGVGLSYHQRFDWALSGLFLYANAPIVAMQQGVHFALNGQNLSDDATRLRYEEIYSYFVGGRVRENVGYPPYYNEVYPPIGRGQTNLTHAKLTGKQGTAGFSDIDFGLGWAFLDRPKYHMAIAIAATAPAGNKPRGEFVFEPIRGNGGHWGLGGNLDGWYRLYKGKTQDLRFNLRAEVRYLFKNGETRTLGLKNRPLGQYYLLGHYLSDYNADTTITQKVPAANVLTRKVDVTPGVQFDGTASFVYTNGGWSIDLGWNPYARESESVKLRGTFPTGTYAVAARNFSTAKADPVSANLVVDNQFTWVDANADGGSLATAEVNNSSIDTAPATTPSQFTNAVYASVGHMWDRGHKHSSILALGGKYEFASKNSALEQWNVWAKMGIEF